MMLSKILISVLFQVTAISYCRESGSGNEDLYSNAFKVILSRGYKYEYFNVMTSDGYFIALYRIVNPVKGVTRQRPVLFIQTLGQGVEWLRNSPGGDADEPINPVGPNLGFEVSKRGFDVWLMDFRANIPTTYNHTFLNPDTDLPFWDYSMDDIALFDIPAAIDFIRKFTGKDKIAVVSLQWGSTLYFFLASKVRRFNHICQPFIAIAPSFAMSNSFASNFKPVLADIVKSAKQHRGILASGEQFKHLGGILCREPIDQLICNPIIYLLTVISLPVFMIGSANYKRMSVYITTGQAIESAWMIAQEISFSLDQKVTMLDIDPETNLMRYGTTQAPEYFAENITNPEMHFISAPSDLQFTDRDIEMLKQRLPVRVKSHYKIPADFSVLSYLDGMPHDVASFVNAPVIRILNQYN